MAGNFADSQNLVDIKDIRQDTLIMKSGALCQVLMVGGVNFSLKSEDEQNLLISSYQNFLNSIEFSVQIVIHSRKINIDHYLNELGERLSQEPSPLLQNQISEYREFIRQFVSENAIMQKMFMVIIPWHPAIISKTSNNPFKLSLFSKKPAKTPEEAQKEKEEGEDAMLKENLPQLSQRVNEVVRGLSQMGLDSVALKNEELAEMFFNFYNPESVERESSSTKLTGEETKKQ